MALQDKLKDSTLSLEGNGFDPSLKTPSWGFKNPDIKDTKLNPLDPKLSVLQNTYSTNTTPVTQIVSFNKTAYRPYLPTESNLDELDPKAPSNTQAGIAGSIVSQIYKSSTGKKYKDLGPSDGRY
jgi:hypothetical protein